MTRSRWHEYACFLLYHHLIATHGHGMVGHEYSVKGGRIDVVRFEDDGYTLAELYEVKRRNPQQGIAQLLRYGAAVGRDVALTLVIEPATYRPALAKRCEDAGVRLWPLAVVATEEPVEDEEPATTPSRANGDGLPKQEVTA